MTFPAPVRLFNQSRPSQPACRLAVLGLLLMLLASCAPQPPTKTQRPQAGDRTPANNPAQWVGRWVGAQNSQLLIMPGPCGDYGISLVNSRGQQWQHTGNVSGQRLYIKHAGHTRAIAPKPDGASPDGLRNCLIMQPGDRQFCRRPQSVDALPLAPGAYVNGRQQCHQASADNLLIFTGQQFKRIGRPNCRAAIFDQQGSLFHARVQCGATRSGGVHQSMHIPDSRHMALTSPDGVTRLYRRCDSHRLPATLRNQLGR